MSEADERRIRSVPPPPRYKEMHTKYGRSKTSLPGVKVYPVDQDRSTRLLKEAYLETGNAKNLDSTLESPEKRKSSFRVLLNTGGVKSMAAPESLARVEFKLRQEKRLHEWEALALVGQVERRLQQGNFQGGVDLLQKAKVQYMKAKDKKR